LVANQQKFIDSQLAALVPTQSPPVTVASLSPPSPVMSTSPTVLTSPVSDFQSQLLLTLTESFGKLSSALTDQKQDSKAEWPKFSGDLKRFRAWYLGIMAQISLSPWLDLYDSSKNDVVTLMTNSTLNGILYSKLLLALDGPVYQHFVSRKHLQANGILLLQELVQTYKPKNVPEIIAANTVEFWGNTKRLPSESIDSYYNRFHELLEDLSNADEPIALKSAICQFVFTLGPEFETIQNNFRIGNLPSAWNTQDWPTPLMLCRDYYNSVKPGSFNHRSSQNTIEQGFDREAHQKKVKEWFMSPVKFCHEIEAEQKRHPGKCIYHLS
jgi:hypothetical protein